MTPAHLGTLFIALFCALASACASAPTASQDAWTDTPAGLATTLTALRRQPRPSPTARATRARLEQALGLSAAAADDWLATLNTAELRPWAALNLSVLADATPIDASWLARVQPYPDLAELAEALALKLGDGAALREARARLGTGFTWRRTGRLLRFPGRTDSPAVSPGQFAEPLVSTAGYLASPEEGAGLYAFELTAPPGDYSVEIRSEGAIRAFIGGELVLDHPALETLAPRSARLHATLSAGKTLQIHIVARTAVARARVFLRAAKSAPSPVIAMLGDFAHRFGALELALADGDITTAYDLIGALPTSPLTRFASARLAVLDPSRAPERARAAAKALLAGILEREPGFVEARAELIALHAEDLELDDARRVAGDLDIADDALTPAIIAALQPNDPAGAARRAEALVARLPRSCDARERWLDNAWERLRLHPAEVVAAFDTALAPLPGACLDAKLRAISLARESFDLAGAERLLAPLLDPETGLDPGIDRARAHALAAQNALARGDWAAAIAAAQQALHDGGSDPFARELLGRAERLAGGPATPRIDPQRDIGLPLRDARPLIAAARAKRPTTAADGREVLLDDRFVRVSADGSLRIRVHHMVRVNNVAAVEAVGELPIPDDAEILFVRTWKATRAGVRSLEPEDILEKSTVSLPNLTPGDIAEWAYFYPFAASARVAPGWRAPTYAFDDARASVAESRYTLSLAPGARPPVFLVDPRVRPPTRPDAATWVFEARSLPRVFSEPGDPLPESRLMTLIASSGIERMPLADALAAEVALGTRVTPTIDAMRAEALADVPEDAPPAAKVQALYDYVRRVVDEPEQATPFGIEASWVAERRRGSRPLLLTALCRSANLGCELVLARPLWDGPEPAQPDVAGLNYALVRWAPIGGTVRWLDPISRWMPFGLLPPALEGVFALSLGARQRGAATAKPPSLLQTPAVSPDVEPTHWGERKVAMKLAFGADGATVTAEGEEHLDGVFAASWRVALVAMPIAARVRVLGSIVQQALPTATVDAIVIDDLEDDTRPLTWRWRATTTTVASERLNERGARTLQMALFPEGLTHDTVLMPERTTPLLVNRAARMTLSITFTAAPGWAFLRAPSDQTFVYDLGHFKRSSRYEDLGRTVVVDKRFLLRPGVIDPARYPAWSDAAVAIDRFDVIQVVAARTSKPLPSTP